MGFCPIGIQSKVFQILRSTEAELVIVGRAVL
jgi:hypothetical protein